MNSFDLKTGVFLCGMIREDLEADVPRIQRSLFK